MRDMCENGTEIGPCEINESGHGWLEAQVLRRNRYRRQMDAEWASECETKEYRQNMQYAKNLRAIPPVTKQVKKAIVA